MNYLPDKFEVSYVFFGLGGSNNLCLKGDKIDFEYKPESCLKNKPIKLEISLLKDEWLRFWIKMDEIGPWEWDKKYVSSRKYFR